MLNQFYISFAKPALNSLHLKHIQYNIHDRIRKLKYVTYRRLDFTLVDENKGAAEIGWDDQKSAIITCYIDPEIALSNTVKEGIIGIYIAMFAALEVLWTRNGWVVEDLREIFLAVERDHFLSSGYFGKEAVSMDKKYKAAFFCELHPTYTDYYLRIIGRGKKLVQEIKFLKGHPNPSFFFFFFSNRIWRDAEYFLLVDKNKEIFFIFNVNSDGFSIEYRPIHNSLEECKNYMAAFQEGVSHKDVLRLFGMPPGN